MPGSAPAPLPSTRSHPWSISRPPVWPTTAPSHDVVVIRSSRRQWVARSPSASSTATGYGAAAIAADTSSHADVVTPASVADAGTRKRGGTPRWDAAPFSSKSVRVAVARRGGLLLGRLLDHGRLRGQHQPGDGGGVRHRGPGHLDR